MKATSISPPSPETDVHLARFQNQILEIHLFHFGLEEEPHGTERGLEEAARASVPGRAGKGFQCRDGNTAELSPFGFCVIYDFF